MRTFLQKILLLFVCFGFYAELHGQQLIEQNWEEFYSYQDSIFNVSTDLDANDDLFVTGFVFTTLEGRNMITLKYSETGSLLWANDYHSSTDDRGFKNLCDNSGNVYTLGSSSDGVTMQSVLIKYNSAGNELWTYSVNIGSLNEPKDLAINSNGNLLVLCDINTAGQKDVLLTEISTSGSLLNSFQYDSGFEDYSVNIDVSANKIALGLSINNGGIINSKVFQLSSNLTQDWFFDLALNNFHEVKAVKFDGDENIVALSDKDNTLHQATVSKFSTVGTNLWNLDLDDRNSYQLGKCLFIDGQNNILTSYAHNLTTEVSTHLVDELGNLTWNKYYYGSVPFKNFGIISDGSKIVVAGTEANAITSNMVMFSLDYDGVLGWENRENGNGGNRNILTDFDINTNNHIVITGQIKLGLVFQIAVYDFSERVAFDALDFNQTPSGTLAYFQNVNQIKDFNGDEIVGLSYYGNFNDNGNYLFNKTFSHTYFKSDGDSSTTDSIIRWDFIFGGNFIPVEPTGINPVGYYANYYYSDVQREKVNGYKKIVYPNVYPKIDIEIGENAFGNVIYFVVYPGADYHDIEWMIDGAVATINSDGSLTCNAGGHNQTYQKPIVYQLDNSGNPQLHPYPPVNFGYQLDGSQNVSFDFPSSFFNNGKPFVIEMTQTGTYQTKSSTDNFNWCSYIRKSDQPSFGAAISKITSDNLNNTYYAGNVYDNNSTFGVFPTTTGLVIAFPIGENDITVMKLNDNIEIQWATYYGGTGSDYATSIAVNPSATNIFVVGSSASTDFPTAVGSGATPVDGAIGQTFILQLDVDGTATWATKFELAGFNDGGGVYRPGIRDCEVINENLYVVGSLAGIAPSTLPDNGFDYYSTTGTGFIGIFKAGGEYFHGSAFGSTSATPENTVIYAIDWNGANNFAITGATNDPLFPIVAAPIGHDSYSSADSDYSNAFISNIKLDGTVDFSYFISSVDAPTQSTNLAGVDTFYDLLGDRGNDIKFSPDGSSIYLVGEVFGEYLETTPLGNPNAYFQNTRFQAYNGFNALRPSGFIFKTDLTGNVLLSTYFCGSALVDLDNMATRLQEISFDNIGNYFISGHLITSTVQNTPISGQYNVPIPSTQPNGFYQKNVPTYSSLPCAGSGIDQESYIIGFNINDEHIWSTYVSGDRPDQIKPVEVTTNNHLYFAGSANTINNNIDINCVGESNADKDQIKFPYWDFNSSSSLDWYNPDGANQTSEFAGRFDVNGVNDPGPVLSVVEENPHVGLTVYPNPNSIGVLNISVTDASINRLYIYTIDGKMVFNLNQSGITSVNISTLLSGTYIIQCVADNHVYNTKFVVQ